MKKMFKPHREINTPEGGQYLHRWHLIPRNRFCNLYLHRFLASDDDRALHDHPWYSLSLILRGRYLEIFRAGGEGPVLDRICRAGRLYLRRAKTAHRIALIEGGGEVWTLFLTGPTIREWGFLCPQGWRVSRDFHRKRPDGLYVGCGED